MNDAVAKAFLRSKEARMIVASFLSEVTGIDKSVLMNATYTGGEIPKIYGSSRKIRRISNGS